MTDEDRLLEVENDQVDQDAKAVQNLSSKLEELTESRNEERFIFVVIIVLLFNAVLIENMESLGALLVIIIPEVVVFFVLAYRCGVDIIFTWLDNFLNKVKWK